jgi:hypothetical protein
MDLRELLKAAAPRPDELDLERVHRRGRLRRNRSRLAMSALGVLAVAVAAGMVALISESSDNGRRIATKPPSTESSTTTTPTTTVPPASTRVVVNDSKVHAFVAAVNDTLGRQPWEDRCTNAAERFSVGIPAGWFAPTPDPPDPAQWPAGSMSLASYDCEFFNFTPSTTICICTPNVGTVEVGPHVGYGTYADAVSNMARIGSDDHVVTEISGHEAECFSRPFGPGEVGEGYGAFCFMERDGGVLFMSVSVGAPLQEELAADGTVLRSTPLPVPDEAREAARRLRDAIVQSIQLIE